MKHKKNLRIVKTNYHYDYNICIEFDGRQHYESIDYFGGDITLNKIKNRDKIKNDFCKNNNIRLIRIKHNENVNLLNLINI